jgi:hypothetical protein
MGGFQWRNIPTFGSSKRKLFEDKRREWELANLGTNGCRNQYSNDNYVVGLT